MRGVDVDAIASVRDGDVFALLGEELGAIGEAGGVDHLPRNEMVVEDGAELLYCHV